ncbi:MAG: membrane dipeptidase [Robiginitomaculum sp.]
MGLSRRKVMLGGLGALGLIGAGGYLKLKPKPIVLGFVADPDVVIRAKALIAKVQSFDLHAHPGRTFATGASDLKGIIKLYTLMGSFEDKAVADMRAGGMNCVTFCTVADLQILEVVKGKGLSTWREFEPGEAWESHKRQMGNLKALAQSGLVTAVFNTSDITKARAAGEIACLYGAEGGDFLGGSVERLRETYEDGLRVINPIHYHHNELGDMMTAAPKHGGLTDAGIAIIKEMNRLGMVIDGAHASLDSLSGMLDISDKPIICSHTHILSDKMPNMPRFITKDLAKRIAEGGGIIGGWPAGLGINTMDGFISRILELVDSVGIDHVGFGTDMDANYKPVWDDYADFPLVVTALMQRGMHDDEIAKIIGGNAMRVMAAVTG